MAPVFGEVIYPLDDFDDATPPNDFYGNQEIWYLNGAVINASFDTSVFFGGNGASWKVTYDVQQSGAEGGISENFTHNYLNPWDPAYDLTRFEEFRFRVRGDQVRIKGKLTNDFTTKFFIEFVDRNWNKKIVEIVGVTKDWQEFSVALGGTGVDWTQMKQFGVVLRNGHVNDAQGALFFDDLRFVDVNAGYATDDEFLDLVSEAAFRYFWDTAHPMTGLTRDRALSPNECSIAAVGFQLTSLGIGAERGWVSRADAAQRAKLILTTLWGGPQGPGLTGVSGYKGFFYHFLDIDTGLRHGDSELSTIDSALCLGGVLFAREYFDSADPVETEVRTLADNIYRRVDWTFIYDSFINQFRMAWLPESGFLSNYWDDYTDEVILISLYAIGSPTFPVTVESFYGWPRQEGSYGGYTLVRSWSGAMFHYQFAHNWFDLRGKWDRHPTRPINWFENAIKAARANRQFCIDNNPTYYTYGPNSWGLTAGATPSGYNYSTGAEPLGFAPAQHDGTINVYGAGSAITFTPVESIAALKHYYENNPKLWDWFGFRDAYNLKGSSNPADDWYAHDHIGIDDGPLLVGIENHRTGLVWQKFMANPYVQVAMDAVFTTMPPPPPAFDDFEGTNINDGWLEGISGTFPIIDPANTEHVNSGAKALKAVYDKGGQAYAFLSAPVTAGSSDFSGFGKLKTWIYSSKTVTYIVRIEYTGGAGYVDGSFSVAANTWQEINFDFSARSNEMINVTRVLYFPEPGKRRVSGTFWLDDITMTP